MDTIKKIEIDNYGGDEYYKALAHRGDVFIVYNVYGIMTQMYYHLNRKDDIKDLKPENCIRIKPFNDYWEKNHEKPFFAMNMNSAINSGRQMLVSIK